VLFVVYPEFRQTYFEILSGAGAWKASIALMALAFIATIGLYLSFAHIFMTRKKSWFDKTCIGAFIMGTNGFAGIDAALSLVDPDPHSPLEYLNGHNIVISARAE